MYRWFRSLNKYKLNSSKQRKYGIGLLKFIQKNFNGNVKKLKF